VATLSGGKAAQSRPDLINIKQSQHVTLRDLTMLNSPQFHVYMQDVIFVDVRNITIWVDIERQRDLLIKAGQWLELDGVGADGLGKGLPMFPLNTGTIRRFFATLRQRQAITRHLLYCTRTADYVFLPSHRWHRHRWNEHLRR
jgi:hypothetical protein